MNILLFLSFLFNVFIVLSILIQQEDIKTSSLALESTNFFSNSLEKLTFFLLFIQLFFLLIQSKLNFF